VIKKTPTSSTITVLVIAPKDRYRRAGIGFTKGENKVEVTEEQLAQLQADHRLKVSTPADPSAKQTKPKPKPKESDNNPGADA
jgi:hypothetical protein